jgi:threonine dehydrogenase-like Zn-dependent dehydrogenase
MINDDVAPSGTMRALQMQGIGRLVEVTLPIPRPSRGEVLVRTRFATICTSDLHDLRGNPFGIALPQVLGHEGAGHVVACGPLVRGLSVGQPVAIHPVISCGTCPTCLRGHRHLCERMGHLGVDRAGTFAEFVVVPQSRVRPVSLRMDLAIAALSEPLCVCMEAVARIRLCEDDHLVVMGDGPFGLLIAKLALRRRPRSVVLVGNEPFRLARVPGARVIHAPSCGNLNDAIRNACDGKAADAAILAVASPTALADCMRILRPRGRLGIFAALSNAVPIDLFTLHVKELELLGCCNDDDLFAAAVRLLDDQELRLDQLITHRLPFGQWEQGFDLAANHPGKTLKVALDFGAPAIRSSHVTDLAGMSA